MDDDPYPPEYDPTQKTPPRGIFCALLLVMTTWIIILGVGLLVFACAFDPQQRVEGPLAFWVMLFAGCTVIFAWTWIGLDWCIWQMSEAWEYMKHREWRYPEGELYGPGKEPHHMKENRK
jgi:hypothetical protein